MKYPLSTAALFLALFATGTSSADGWILREGRFPGNSIVIHLSPDQANRLDYIHKCRGDNTLTPYVFNLTVEQAGFVKSKSGVNATRFAVFDSTLGDTSVDLEANVLIRFSSDQAEIPTELLTSDHDAREYERDVIGWKENPIERSASSRITDWKCPS